AVQAFSFLAGLDGVAMVQPSPSVIGPHAGAYPVAYSSPLSFETAHSSGPAVVARGPFVVAAAEFVGAGTILVLGDPQFFTNALWSSGDNKALGANLFSNATVYVDTSHWQANTIASLKAEFALFYSQASGFPL